MEIEFIFTSKWSEQSSASSQSSFFIPDLLKVATKLNGMTAILYYHFRHGERFSSAQILKHDDVDVDSMTELHIQFFDFYSF